jgi:hypothetical protein
MTYTTRPIARTTAFGGYTKKTSTTFTKQTTAPTGTSQITQNMAVKQPSTGSIPMTAEQRARRRARISRGRLAKKARSGMRTIRR